MQKFKIIFIFLTMIIITVFTSRTNAQEIKPPSQKYLQALHFMGSQNYDKAIIELSAIIDKYPLESKPYLKIFEAYKWKNELDACLVYFNKLANKDPNNPYIYHALGLIFREQKELHKALQNYRQTIRLAPEYPVVYKDLVDTFKELNRLEEASDFIKNLIKQNSENATAYYGLGYVYQLQEKWKDGLKNIDNALKINKYLFNAYFTKGAIYWYTSRFQDFLNISLTGLKLAEDKKDIEVQCKLLGNIGLAYLYLADYSNALKFSEQALTLAKQIGCRAEEVRTLGNIGVIYRDTNKFPQALNFFNKAIIKAQQTGDRKREGLFYRNIGTVYNKMDDYVQALNYYQKSLPIVNEIGDKKTEGLLLWSMGLAHWNIGNFPRALEYNQQAYAIAKEMGDKWGQERYLIALGLVYWNFGKYSQALDCYEMSLKIAKEIQDPVGEGINLGDMAIIFHALGDYKKALEYYTKALTISRKIKNKYEESRHLSNIGVVYHDLNDFESALNYYQKALEINKEINHRRNETASLGNIGLLYSSLGDHTAAFKCINQSLSIAKEINDKRSEGSQYINLGTLNLSLENYSASLKYYCQALVIGEKILEPTIIWEAQTGVAQAYEKLGEFYKSLNHYKLALDEIEKVRVLLPIEKFKAGFFETKINVFERIIQLLNILYEQQPLNDFHKKSFQYAERAKARTFLDIIYQGRIFHNLTEIPDDFRQKFLVNEKNIEVKHSKLAMELAKFEEHQDKALISSLNNEIEFLQREKARLLKELKEKFPRYYEITNPKLLSCEEVQDNVLHENQVLVEYFVGDEKIFVWVLTKNQVKFKTISLTRQELETKLAGISPIFKKEKEINNVRIDHRWANINATRLLELYNILLKNPTEGILHRGAELIIVPDDLLYYFPFEILVNEIKSNKVNYLIETHPISYAYSASMLSPGLKKERNAEFNLLAFGNPDFGSEPKKRIIDWINSYSLFKTIMRNDQFEALPNAEHEVVEIAKNINNSVVYVGQEASEECFKQIANSYKFIHLATHYLNNDKQPMYSKIIFAQNNKKIEDGYLQTYEVYNLKLNAEMVVLSGCNTGLGKLSRGEGLVGMSRAFLYAGVPGIVVSLWPVDDESTALLMKSFYNFLQKGLNKTQALQQAKLSLIKSNDMKRDPFYWGSFILIGDWSKVQMK